MRQRGMLPGPGVLALVTIVAAAACGPAAPASPRPPPGASAPSAPPTAPPAQPRAARDVLVGVVVQSATQLPFYVGVKAGIFEEEGLRVTVTQMPIPTMLAGLVEGQVGYSTTGGSVIRAAASGQPLRLIAGGKSAPDWQLFVQPAINSVPELRGKRLGVSAPTSAATLATYEILEKYGVGRQDLDAINLLGTGGVLQGLVTRQVDGGLVGPPQTSLARREGLKSLLRAADEVELLQGGVGTSAQRIREQPAEVESLLRGLLRSIRVMRENKPLVVDVLIEQFEGERDVAAEMYDEVVPDFLPDASASDAVIQREIAAHEESIGEKLNVSVQDVVDFGPLQRAQAALGLASRTR